MTSNQEVGVKRLFYALWAALLTYTFGYLIYRAIEGRLFMEEAFWLILVSFGIPLFSMLAVRWIYRGFVPRAGSK